MARPKAKAPARRYHISGQSVVTIDGRDFYLGKHDSPESIARYAVLIGIYQASGLRLPDDFDLSDLDNKAGALLGSLTQPQQQTSEPLLVRHITASYREHIKVRYAAHPAELHRLNQICDASDKHEGDMHSYQRQPCFGYSATNINHGNPRFQYCSYHLWRIAANDDPITLPSSQPTGRSIVDIPRFKTEQPRAMFGCISSNTFDDLSPVSPRCFDQEGYVRSLAHSMNRCTNLTCGVSS
jgi:hypothetical protein